MRNDILHTIHYFAFFQYPPTLQEIYTYHQTPGDMKAIEKTVQQMVQEGMLIEKRYRRKNNVLFRYTTRGYSHFFNIWKGRHNNSNRKLSELFTFVTNIRLLPLIHLLGISGSLSMRNTKQDDDIDLFIITRANRLWTTRFIMLVLAQLAGVRRSRGAAVAKDKICMNLFFDETELRLPSSKHTEYAAHEVLQMKPLINRDNTYMRFLDANEWVFDLFPNASKRRTIPFQFSSSSFSIPFIGDAVEYLLKRLQLFIMNGHRKDERITSTQLWFFPDDFEKKIKKERRG